LGARVNNFADGSGGLHSARCRPWAALMSGTLGAARIPIITTGFNRALLRASIEHYYGLQSNITTGFNRAAAHARSEWVAWHNLSIMPGWSGGTHLALLYP